MNMGRVALQKIQIFACFGAKIIYQNLAGSNFVGQWRNMHCFIVKNH